MSPIVVVARRFFTLALVMAACQPEQADDGRPGVPSPLDRSLVRIALFNIQELSTEKLADVDDRGVGMDPQARAAAAIIQRISPDILVLNEIDHDYDATESGLDLNARRFAQAYLAQGERPLRYGFSYAAPNNTGILSGIDLDGDGRAATVADRGEQAYGNDSYGFGLYPGQYSMAVLSRYPIAAESARTFRRLLWRDLEDHHIPDGFYSAAVLDVFRLSSKSHWDVPVMIGETPVHLFVSHPTPPVFDGFEDRNGRRNFDEIGLWARYLDDDDTLRDDAGTQGGYGSDALFVIAGDLNARPNADESLYEGRTAISQLLDHPRIQDSGPWLTSEGGRRGREAGPPDFWERATTGFGGGSRIDYLLPSTGIEIVDGGVFWPDPGADPTDSALADQASDHRLVWLDLRIGSGSSPTR